MSSNDGTKVGGGVSVFGALFVVLFTLKVLGVEPVVAWSWLSVFLPLLVAIALGVLVVMAAMLSGAIERRARRKWQRVARNLEK